MKFDNEAIGARLMETITSGLYDGNVNCLREYAQNGIDSKGSTKVEIYFENGDNDLIIKDDGSGMNEEELKKALRIGISEKQAEEVGWRGIGIWSGVPACQRIIIITKEKNNKKLRIRIDNKILREENLSNKYVLDILTNATSEITEETLGKDESFEDDHYTIIRLESILGPQKIFFNEKNIKEYLKRNLPVPFNKKQFKHSTEINNWLKDNKVRISETKIEFQGEAIYRPPYETDIFFNNVIKKEFKINNKILAYGWFLTSYNNGKLKEPNNGIYFKKHGFTIGDKNTVIMHSKKTYSQWQYGEIHVVADELRENAARNSFEYNNIISDHFFEAVGEYINWLQKENKFQSDTTIDERAIKKTQLLIDKGNLPAAKKEIDKLKNRIYKLRNFPKEESLQDMKPLIESKASQNKKILAKFETKIGKKPVVDEGSQLLFKVISMLPAPVKKDAKRVTKKGLIYPEMSVTDSIKKILKKKTGLEENGINKLSKEAYGWERIEAGGKRPKLLIYGDKDIIGNSKALSRRKTRSRQFGVMVYLVHDLFVNLYKHDQGKESLKWFEDLQGSEQDAMAAGMWAIVGFIYRMIDNSVKN